MTQAAISIRLARPADAADVAAVHDAAWREAYWGIIPGRELEQMVLGQLAWAAVGLLAALWMWQLGVRRHEAVGG